jgi:hypothetical protein
VNENPWLFYDEINIDWDCSLIYDVQFNDDYNVNYDINNDSNGNVDIINGVLIDKLEVEWKENMESAL